MIMFKNKHKGEDIYVLGSGATLNYVDKIFFSNKITICVNEVAEIYLPTSQYVVTKYHKDSISLAKKLPDTIVFVSKGDLGSQHTGQLPNLPNLKTFGHNINKDAATSVVTDWPQDEDYIYVSWSSITSAIHIAAYMGAKNIILVGHDCGELGGKNWVDGYVYYNYNDKEKVEEAVERNKRFELQTISLKGKLISLYGCNIYSLNPFINYNLEGVTYRGNNTIN